MNGKKEIIQIGECHINTLRLNPKSNKNIVFLHGAKFKAQTWLELGTLEYFAQRGYSVTALDMPGFGDSPYCQMEQVDVLKGLIDELKIEQPVVVGPSMGGRITLNFYFKYPQIPKAIVLVGTVGVEENAPRIKSLVIPTLIVWGEKDDIAPIKYANFLKQNVANSKLVIMKDAPHPCYLKDPNEFNKIVNEFLQEVFNV